MRKRNYVARQRTELSIFMVHRPSQTGVVLLLLALCSTSNVLRTERLSAQWTCIALCVTTPLDRKYTHRPNTEAPSLNQCCCGKAINTTYSECTSLALFIQHAKCVHCITVTSVACLSPSYFSTLSNAWHDFRRKNLLNIKCVFCFSFKIFVRNISHCKKNSARSNDKCTSVFT